MSNAYLGIDLGTTNSVVSLVREGQAVALSVDGQPSMPSAVLYRQDEVVVGREAKNLYHVHPQDVVLSVKRAMGTEEQFTVNGTSKTPAEISAQVLGRLRQVAKEQAQADVDSVVITVPAYFDEAPRRDTIKAAELAGFSQVHLLNEPTAASLMYDQMGAGKSGQAEQETVLIYDLGGGTFDVSVIDVFAGVREVRASKGDRRLGGDDFDQLIVEHLLAHIEDETGKPPETTELLLARLRRLAEDAKIQLSDKLKTEIRAEFLTEVDGKPFHLQYTLARSQFEQMVEPLLDRTIELVAATLDDARIKAQDLSKICLVGGSTRLPLVTRKLLDRFEVEVDASVDPDLAVGMGAALQAGLLAGAELSRVLVDVSAHSLGVRALALSSQSLSGFDEDSFAVVLPRNSVLPAVGRREFYTMLDGQDMVEVEVYQGESARTSENELVGSFDFDLVPAPAGSRVNVSFSYDLNGVIHVEVEDVEGKKTEQTSYSLQASNAADDPAKALLVQRVRELSERLSGKGANELLELLANFEKAAAGEANDLEDQLLDALGQHEAD